MTAAATVQSPPNTRSLVRQMVEARLDRLDDFQLPGIVAELVDTIKADPAFYARYVEECLYRMVYDEGMSVLASHRARSVQLAELADALTAGASEPAPTSLRQVLERGRAEQRARMRWLGHTEYVGDRHVKLLALYREQLPLAISFRARRRATEDLYIRFLDRLHAEMADGQQVRDAYSVEQLDVIFEQVRKAPARRARR